MSPSRAAETPRWCPAIPPPTTTRSKRPPSSGCSGSPSSSRRNFAKRSRIVGRPELEVLAEENGVAAALEAGQVVQGHLGLRGHLDRAAVLPMPGCAFGSERHRQRLAVDEHLKAAGAPGAFHGATQSRVRTQTR